MHGPDPAAYVRPSSSPHSIQVKNLELRVPTTDAPGSAEGLVKAPQAPYLPAGYTLARNERTSCARPAAPRERRRRRTTNGQFTLAWNASEAATALSYTLEHKNASGGWEVVASGLTGTEYSFSSGNPEGEGTWLYRVAASNEGPSSTSEESAPVVVDETAPNPPQRGRRQAARLRGRRRLVQGHGHGVVHRERRPGALGRKSGQRRGTVVDAVLRRRRSRPTAHTKRRGPSKDNAGNTSSPGRLTRPGRCQPAERRSELSCDSDLSAAAAKATITASDGQSGLAVEPERHGADQHQHGRASGRPRRRLKTTSGTARKRRARRPSNTAR